MELYLKELKELQRSPSSPATGGPKRVNSTALCLISASESTISAPQLSRQPFASNQDTSTGDEVLKCPLCSYRCSVRKSMINHCYVKHRYSWVNARPMPKPPSHVGVVPVRTINRQNCADCSVMTTTATSER